MVRCDMEWLVLTIPVVYAAVCVWGYCLAPKEEPESRFPLRSRSPTHTNLRLPPRSEKNLVKNA